MDDLVPEQAPPTPAEETPLTRKLGRRGFLKLTSVSSAAAALAACAAPPPTSTAGAAIATATAVPPTVVARTAVPPTAVPPTAAAIAPTAATAPTAAAAPAAATSFVSDLLPYPRLKIATLGDLSGGAHNANYPDPASLIQLVKLGKKTVGGVGPDQDIVAYSGICSHMGCPLIYDAARKILQCPCHFSHFDLAADAMLINGPSCQNLPRITLEVDGQDIYAVGVQGLIYGRANNVALV